MKRLVGVGGAGLTNLVGAVPLLPLPLLVEEEVVEVVGQDSGGEGPGTLVAAAARVAPAESVGTGKGDDLLVVEAHAAEDSAEVLLLLGGVGEAAVGRAGGHVAVMAAGAEGDRGALHLLDGGDTSEDPEIRVRDPGELLCCEAR